MPNINQEEKQRTLKQNASLHLFCRNVAAALNEAGIEMSIFVKDIQVPYSEKIIKDIWQAIECAQTAGKTSTTEMTTKECTEIYETFNRHLAQFGIHEDWPSYEAMANKQLKNYDETDHRHIMGNTCSYCKKAGKLKKRR